MWIKIEIHKYKISKRLTNLLRESDLDLGNQIHWQSQITCPEPFLSGEQLFLSAAHCPGTEHSTPPSGWSARTPLETKYEKIGIQYYFPLVHTLKLNTKVSQKLICICSPLSFIAHRSMIITLQQNRIIIHLIITFNFATLESNITLLKNIQN